MELITGVVLLVGGWLARGGLAAYRNRANLTVPQMVAMTIGYGGPGAVDR